MKNKPYLEKGPHLTIKNTIVVCKCLFIKVTYMVVIAPEGET